MLRYNSSVKADHLCGRLIATFKWIPTANYCLYCFIQYLVFLCKGYKKKLKSEIEEQIKQN